MVKNKKLKVVSKTKETNVKNIKRSDMAFDLPIKRILDGRMADALKQLYQMPMCPKAAFRMKEAGKRIYIGMSNYNSNRVAILEKYCEKDESGGFVYEDENKSAYKIPADKEGECFAKLGELGEGTINIPIMKVSEFGNSVTVTTDFIGLLDGCCGRMKLSVSRLFDFATVAATKAAQELQSFIDHYNKSIEEIISALNNKLSFADNFNCQIIDVKLVHGVEAAVSVKSTAIVGVIPLKTVSVTNCIQTLVHSVNQKGQLLLTPAFKTSTTDEITVKILILY